MKIRAILSAGLLLSFLLPWINIKININMLSFAGFLLPTATDALEKWLGYASSSSYLFYGLYLIPLCCIINIIKDVSVFQIKRYFLSEFVIGIVYSAIILLNVIGTNINTSDFSLSIGYYLTAVLSLIGLFVEIRLFVSDKIAQKSRNSTQNAPPIS
jgi:hypothetical protein